MVSRQLEWTKVVPWSIGSGPEFQAFEWVSSLGPGFPLAMEELTLGLGLEIVEVHSSEFLAQVQH